MEPAPRNRHRVMNTIWFDYKQGPLQSRSEEVSDMKAKWISVIAAWVCLTATIPLWAAEGGWTLDGGPVWQKRTGPGASLALGGTTCTGDFCDTTLDVNLFGSFAGTFGFFYRVIPNFVAFAEINTSYINTGMMEMQEDKGFLFQFVVGGEFHLPVTGWLDPYLGFGFGYALLRAKAYNPGQGEEEEEVVSYRGVDLEMKLGVDVFPFSQVPNLSLGVLFRMGFPVWTSACIRGDVTEKYCTDPEVLVNTMPVTGWDYVDQTPFLVFIGLTAKYVFGSAVAPAAAASAKTP